MLHVIALLFVLTAAAAGQTPDGTSIVVSCSECTLGSGG
jgi:hypothetical protein